MSKEKKSVEYDLFEDFSDVDEENIIVGAVTQAVEKFAKSDRQKNLKKLKISGKKSAWREKIFDAVRALRDTIPMKPKKYSWKISEWSEEVANLRDMSIQILENRWTEEEFSDELEK